MYESGAHEIAVVSLHVFPSVVQLSGTHGYFADSLLPLPHLLGHLQETALSIGLD